jgi:toxin ParE1/3/4
LKLRYTLRAAAELAEVLDYISIQSPRGARRVQARIQDIIDLVLRHPRAGTLTSKGRLRRVVAHPYPYLVFYAIDGDEIVIHGVRHGARDPASMPG